MTYTYISFADDGDDDEGLDDLGVTPEQIASMPDGVWTCDDCGAYAEKKADIKHHKSCKPGESERWARFYEKENAMFAGEEFYHFFEDLAKNQSPIYPDAADQGVLIETDDAKGFIGDAVRGLREIYRPHNVANWGEKRRGAFGRSVSFHIPFEKEGNQFCGVLLQISYSVDRPRRVEFASVDISRHTSKVNPFRHD